MNNSGVSAKPKKNYSVDEYLNKEQTEMSKHELFDGKIVASTGSSRRHNLIVTNITIAVGSRLRRQNHELYANNMHVKLSDNDFCYPDVTIVKDSPKFLGKDMDVLLNPSVIIEILPEQIMFRDEVRKLEKYLSLKSINEYLLVREGEMRVEHYSKQNAKHWNYIIYDASDDVISMESIQCKVSMGEFYSQIKY